MAYINDLLIGGNASAQMIGSLPQLTDADGYEDGKLAGTLHLKPMRQLAKSGSTMP